MAIGVRGMWSPLTRQMQKAVFGGQIAWVSVLVIAEAKGALGASKVTEATAVAVTLWATEVTEEQVVSEPPQATGVMAVTEACFKATGVMAAQGAMPAARAGLATEETEAMVGQEPREVKEATEEARAPGVPEALTVVEFS